MAWTGADYRARMDAETFAFIERMDSFYPPEAIGWPIGKNRAVYDAMSRAFHAGRPLGVAAADEMVPAGGGRQVPIRRYRSEEPDPAALVLYLHGGGFMLGNLESHDDLCAEICARTGFETFSVDYRLAPEHRGTAALEDAVAAFQSMKEHAIVLVGESAGGTLAASLAHVARHRPHPPIGQVLVYPALGGAMPKVSLESHVSAPLLSAQDLAVYRCVRSDADSSADMRYEPLGDEDFSALPPTVIVTAECDPLSSDGRLYRDRIEAAGGKAHWHEAPLLPHGFLRGRNSVKRAAEAFEATVAAIAALGHGEWPYA